MAYSVDEASLLPIGRVFRERNVACKFQAAGGPAAGTRVRARQRPSPPVASLPALPPIHIQATRRFAAGTQAGSRLDRSVSQLGRTCAWLGTGARSQSSSALPAGDDGRRPKWWPGYGEVKQKPSPVKRLRVRRNQRQHLMELDRALELPFAFRDLCPPGYVEVPPQDDVQLAQLLSPGALAPWHMPTSPSEPSRRPVSRRQALLHCQADTLTAPIRARAAEPRAENWAQSSAALHKWAEGLLESAKQKRVTNSRLAPMAKAPVAAARAVLDMLAEDVGSAQVAEPALTQSEVADLPLEFEQSRSPSRGGGSFAGNNLLKPMGSESQGDRASQVGSRRSSRAASRSDLRSPSRGGGPFAGNNLLKPMEAESHGDRASQIGSRRSSRAASRSGLRYSTRCESPVTGNNLLKPTGAESQGDRASQVGSRRASRAGFQSQGDKERDKERDARALAAFRSVALLGEVSRDHLSRALQVIGHPVPREDWVEAAAAKVSTAAGARSFFDKADFVAFVAVYESWHWSHLRRVFSQARHDDQGRIGLVDLMALLPQMGVSLMPGALQELAREAAACDAGGAGAAGSARRGLERVDLEHFARLYALGASRAGFTCREHAALAAIFCHCCKPDGFLDTSGMCKAMMQDRWCVLADAAVDAQLPARVQDHREEDGKELRGLALRGFLLAMRERREPGLRRVRAAWEKLRDVRLGLLEVEMLPVLFESLEFLGASPEVVGDAVKAAGFEARTALNSDEVYLILQGYSESHGLSHAELKQIEGVLKEYDLDGSGSIEPMELLYAMRWLGYPANHEQICWMMEELDVDGSRQLELNELQKLVAWYRNKEIGRVRNAFALSSSGQEQLNKSQLRRVLLTLGYTPSHEQVASLEAEGGSSGRLDLWDIVRLLDKFRSQVRKVCRAHHGFTEKQLGKLKKQFEQYDPDDSGFINPRRLLEVLESDASSNSAAHRRAAHLLRVGVQESRGVGLRKGSLTQFAAEHHGVMVDFAGFLKMMRTFQDHREYEQMKREEDAVVATGFSPAELRELRQVHSMFDKDAAGDLSLQELTELLSKVVPQSQGARIAELHKLLVLVDKDGNRKLDFVEFLRLVRLLQDTDWIQISDRSEETSASGLTASNAFAAALGAACSSLSSNASGTASADVAGDTYSDDLTDASSSTYSGISV